MVDPASTGNPAKHRGNQAVYALIDQQIWRPATGEADKGVGVFARLSASPADRNLIDLDFDGGIVFAGLIPGWPEDGAELRRGLCPHYERGTRNRRWRRHRQPGRSYPSRGFEAAFEVNYLIQVLPGLEIDLDLQRIFNPGGSIAGPGGSAIPDATVLTLHTSVKY